MEGLENNTSTVPENNDNNAAPEVNDDKKPAEPTFTQEQVDDIINKRLARERAKFDEQLKTKVSEAERLAKLTEEERRHEELKIQQEQIEQQRKEFEDMKREFERTQLLNETQRQLGEKNLPIDVAEMLLGKDADSTKANIDKFESKWLESLQKAVEDKLNNSSVSPRTPVRDNMGQKHKDTSKMSLEEFIEYKKNN